MFAALPVGTSLGDLVTSTATERGLLGLFPVNTSEFSPCYEIGGATFILSVTAIRDVLSTLSSMALIGERWAGFLGARIDAAVRLVERRRVRAARAQLGVFQIIVRILGRRGEISPEAAQPLLASSEAAQALLGEAGPPPRWRWIRRR